jgi:hypothetical protein
MMINNRIKARNKKLIPSVTILFPIIYIQKINKKVSKIIKKIL